MEQPGINESKRMELETKSRAEMERLSQKLRDLILTQPPKDLLGYLWSRLLLKSLRREDVQPASDDGGMSSEAGSSEESQEHLSKLQFVLEYVHAALASSSIPQPMTPLSEPVCEDILRTAEALHAETFNYCIASTPATQDGVFGPRTGQVEIMAKSNWVLLRGSRYQVLEREFFSYVLDPHDQALRHAYGAGATEIAEGIQAIADSMREGHMRAFETIKDAMKHAHLLGAESTTDAREAIERWRRDYPDRAQAAADAVEDVFRGGICNLTRHTMLPKSLLDDFAFQRGENKEFFAPGDLCGTPLRTLPARIKPLVNLSDGTYATDQSFARDSGYRALQRGLLNRYPAYREEWNVRQKTLSEHAFADILSHQVAGAAIYYDVYYQDVSSKQWVENDALILLDDVLIQIEAKAGVAAMHSPALNFDRHVRSIKNLVLSAYSQCTRFLKYLHSQDVVPIYQLVDGQYQEIRHVHLEDYKVVIPIGLTVESFAPFSAMCKELPQITPILGKFPFISMSIDDLFVLNRFLVTTGELLHYLEVRQSVAGIRDTQLFDEFDHLGAYISRNRFDFDLTERLSEGANSIVMDRFSDVVDQFFAGDRWQNEDAPKQECPQEILDLLSALDRIRKTGWLHADRMIRNLGAEARTTLSKMLQHHRSTLDKYQHRWFVYGEDPSLLVWLQRAGTQVDSNQVHYRASAAALAMKSTDMVAVVAVPNADDGYMSAERVSVEFPTEQDVGYASILAEAKRMRERIGSMEDGLGKESRVRQRRKIGRNEKCWCGSGKKYKRCHGVTA